MHNEVGRSQPAAALHPRYARCCGSSGDTAWERHPL